MSDVIKLLPDSVANQIAAGEVIQRPASVIKELVENAIDAGATSIKIVLKDAGRTLIQVIDNGTGMSETDARLAFERHATSKIKSADDLFALHTMGFRGEALASIAAIAQVELRTRKRGAQMGTRVCISASTCESQEADYCPEGSNFMIKNIFFNVPARRKFLKSNKVELGNIVREFEKLALVNYSTEFTLIHNDTTMFQLMGGDSFKHRIVTLFSRSLEQQLVPIETETSIVKINGFVGRPENARKRNALQYLFVNGRHMRHPYFQKAVMACYDQLITADEQPNYFLNFTVDPETIDVNIHPTKSEIKFENEQAIWQILFAAVKEALGKFSAVPSIDFDTEGAIDFPITPSSETDFAMPTVELDPNYNPFKESARTHSSGRQTTSYVTDSKLTARPFTDQRTDDNLQNWDLLYQNFERGRSESIEHISSLTPEPETTPATMPSVESIDANLQELADGGQGNSYTQIKKKYILTQNKSGLVFIDQHRAHVRVLFDKMIATKLTEKIESQRVIFQEVIELSSAQNLILEELQPEMEKMGFELSFLGNNSWTLNSIPAVLLKVNTREFILDVVDTVINGGADISSKMAEHIALSSAKAAAIKYGQTLSQNEMDNLVASLFSSKEPKYTPDRKLVINMMSYDDIAKMFI